MKRRTVLLAAPPTAVALAVGGFIGYGAWTRSGDVDYARGSTEFAVPAPAEPTIAALVPGSGTPQPLIAPAPRSTSGGPAARATTAPPPVTTAARGTRPSRTAAAPQGPTSAPSAGPAAPTADPTKAPARTVPVFGTYGVLVRGTEEAKFGPFSLCGGDLPGSSSWVIGAAPGEPVGSWQLDHRLYPGSAAKHDERHIYRAVDGQVVVTFEQAVVTCLGARQATELSYAPNQVRVRLPLRVGATWQHRGGDAERTESGRSVVTGTQVLTVGGRPFSTWVIQTDLQLSGAETGERHQTWWWSPELAMPLKTSESIRAEKSGGTYKNDYTTLVTSLPPGAQVRR